jgi:hypothetical protein
MYHYLLVYYDTRNLSKGANIQRQEMWGYHISSELLRIKRCKSGGIKNIPNEKKKKKRKKEGAKKKTKTGRLQGLRHKINRGAGIRSSRRQDIVQWRECPVPSDAGNPRGSSCLRAEADQPAFLPAA